jgi:hypothetical protein
VIPRRRTIVVVLFAMLACLCTASPASDAQTLGGLGMGPKAHATKDRRGRIAAFPSFRGAVPVLLYHGLVDRDDGYSVAPATFDAQLQRLHQLGFEAITLDRYVAFMRGSKVELPRRPILITFDDGLRSSWTGADQVLARYDFSAAMYLPTGLVGRPGHLTWDELRQMQSSGRWQIDEHAGDGHVLITVDARGRQGPFYANELWANGNRESFANYKRRVAEDIERGQSQLAHELPGKSHHTFAVPFNNYGQFESNDKRIEPWFTSYLKARFTVAFVQRDYSFTRPRQRFANRIVMASRSSPDTLELHLLKGVEQLNRTARLGHLSR